MKTIESGIIRYLSVTGVLFLLIMFMGGCTQKDVPSESSVAQSPDALSKPIIHHASVGGPDFSPPGVDANFSLVANMDVDGNVSGQWQDVFGGVIGGASGRIHVAVDCMTIVLSGRGAIVGGVITHGTVNGVDVSGQRAVTMVVDNGGSANDPPDQISYSWFAPTIATCGIYTPDDFQGFLFDFTRGQVTVR